ncbi:Transcriptional regulator GlxA family, contains an amidase domain and an AraC-type DNA-binding HTH domain [Modicisalibacter ilicicola DSM 19980]|uniref:Transcriptional regulator GlxA family, contains an amidase domain and an AraC-type DNA-binding HTH domain n=1 Tax=Modicisalibacter ilicicola DSM 19980 TaxID=1121942 RepID=A0A1M4WG22_9GAMM|nr:GlxA family transcriptional regulator [Halomonas ilicicola]SHE80013.1 Transcriptional regulator GlxA family, contains an amidase domain and an AraC-type DNA-binding HTH domain [Halomonas ilicicola DSM 19980]
MTPANSQRLSIGFVLLPRFTMLPFAGFVDCLRLAADEGDMSRQLRCHWTFMTSDGEGALSSCGATITPCEQYQDPARFDYLVVIAGVLKDKEMVDRATIDYLKRADRQGVPLVGICTGVFALIQAGLMHQRRCCVSWYHHGDLVRRFGQVTPVSDRLFIDDGDRLTCAGGIASADLAAYLVERHLGRAWAKKSLHIMLIDEARQGNHPQPHPLVLNKVDNRQVRRAIAIIEQHLGELISVDELADRVGCSRRGLERSFRESLGVSPQKFSRDLRLRYGLWLLHFTSKSITEVGERCGFSDTAHFSRNFKDTFGYSPSEVRKGTVGLQEDLVDPFFLHIGKT